MDNNEITAGFDEKDMLLTDVELDSMPKASVDALNEILLNTQEQCQMVSQLIENQIQVKDQMIDRLHSDLSYYRQESADRFIEQLMKSVIKIRKDMKRRMASDGWQELSAEELRREYQYTFEDISDLLEQQNVDEYVSEAGSDFDPALHQAKTEPTDDAALNKKIKVSLSEGYKKGDKVIMPERVIVYQLKGE